MSDTPEDEQSAAALDEPSEVLRRMLAPTADDIAAIEKRLESIGRNLLELLAATSPLDYLGYSWSQLALNSLKIEDTRSEDQVLDESEVYLALEYAHAAWASVAAPEKESKFTEDVAKKSFSLSSELRSVSMQYAMITANESKSQTFGAQIRDIEFRAKSTWLLIRGHRYQVLEGEFFSFVLQPHNEALLRAYGMTAVQIASGIQRLADSQRRGISKAVEKSRMLTNGLDETPSI